ncbi:MAG: phospholipase D-like domain-containing protein, partial [Ktedonobacteraceae bacterium]
HRFSLLRTLLGVTSVMIALEAVTVMILQIISLLRKFNRQEGSFPHPNLSEVSLGENDLQLYDYGHDLYKAMLAAIDTAQESIYLETYIWKGDAIGQTFKQRLAYKATRGVNVYVVFDSFANTVVPRDFKVFPQNIHVLKYQGIRRPWHLLDPRRYALDHRKLLIVDGYTSFIGGYNIGSLYATTWRDTHLRMRGPASADLAQSFTDLWNRHTPEHERITRHYQRRFDPLIQERGTDALRLTFPIRDMYIEAIDRAEHSIRLTNAYFAPDHMQLEALTAAAERGVDVQVLVPWVSNHVVVDWLARGYFTDCLKAGISVFGYHQMLHAKTCTIDGQWSTIGTANLDRLSSVGNYEINAEIYSESLAQQMGELFKWDTPNAWKLTPDQWLKRPWYAVLGERILTPLRILL